jgi:hypothetical protein
MKSLWISSLIRSSIASSLVVSIVIGSSGDGDKPSVCGKTSVGENEWKANVDEFTDEHDDLCGEIGGKVALMSVEPEDVDEERDESENALKSMLNIGAEKHGIFVKAISSGSSTLAKSSVK